MSFSLLKRLLHPLPAQVVMLPVMRKFTFSDRHAHSSLAKKKASVWHQTLFSSKSQI